MNRKVLHFEIPETNYVYSPPTAFLFNILNSAAKNDRKIWDWIVSNFINICCDINIYAPDIPNELLVFQDFFRQDLWYSCPFIESMDLKADYLNYLCRKGFSKFVKNAIDLNYYVYADLNCHYIPNYKTSIDIQHNLLLYGYDESSINIADYFRNRKLSWEQCSALNIDLAYSELVKVEEYERFHTVNLFKYKKNENYEFKICDIKYALLNYINADNLLDKYQYAFFAYEYKNHGELFCGIAYYDALIEMLKLKRSFTPRSIHLLVMHKTIMMERLKVLKEKGIIILDRLIDECNIILEKTIALRNYIIKINLRNKSEKIYNLDDQTKVRNKILSLKMADYKFTKKLIEIL